MRREYRGGGGGVLILMLEGRVGKDVKDTKGHGVAFAYVQWLLDPGFSSRLWM